MKGIAIMFTLFLALVLVGLVMYEFNTRDESGYGEVAKFFGYGVPPEPIDDPTLRERGLHMMDRLVTVHGWTPEAAAIAAGNAQQESNLATKGKAGDSESAHELFQWRHERFDALKAFAKEQGKDYQDFDLQVDFLNDEIKHRSKLEKTWPQVTDLVQAARFSHLYEVYGDSTTPTRVKNAKKWLRVYKAAHS